MKTIRAIVLGLSFVCCVNATPILNFNAGATDAETPAAYTNLGATGIWNNLKTFNSTIGSLKYADNTDATGITVTQVAQGRNNPANGSSAYDPALAQMTGDGLWRNTNPAQLSITELTPGSVWHVDIYAGVKTGGGSTRSAIVSAIGTTTNSYPDTQYNVLADLGGPVSFSNMVANESGIIVMSVQGTTNGADPNVAGYLLGGTLTWVSDPPLPPPPPPMLILNLNAGETATGQETMNDETWNNLNGRGTAIGSLKYADNTDASGIEVIQTASGEFNANASGYITGLDSMSTRGLWNSAPTTFKTSSLTVSGLTPGVLYDVDVYCAINNDVRTSILSANGVTSADQSYDTRYDLHAPVTLSDVVVDVNGIIVVASAGTGATANGVLNGATLTTEVIPKGTLILIQ